MKNITVSVPEPVYRQARVKAAERGRSLSALVRDFLTSLAEDAESEFRRRRQLQDRVLARRRRFSAGSRLPRTQVHERRALR